VEGYGLPGKKNKKKSHRLSVGLKSRIIEESKNRRIEESEGMLRGAIVALTCDKIVPSHYGIVDGDIPVGQQH
jgi:hypothetical protein